MFSEELNEESGTYSNGRVYPLFARAVNPLGSVIPVDTERVLDLLLSNPRTDAVVGIEVPGANLGVKFISDIPEASRILS